METRVLRYFIEIARSGSFSAAAGLLHITQPTLSRQIKDLELSLGVVLFERRGSGVVLTEAGLKLKKHATEILRLVDQAELDFTAGYETVHGSVEFGLSDGADDNALFNILFDFHHRYPGVVYDIHTGNSDEVCTQIDDGLVEFGVVIEPVNIDRFDFIKIGRAHRVGVYVDASSSLSNKTSIEAADLHKQALITPNQEMLKSMLAGWIGGNIRHFHHFATYSTFDVAIHLAHKFKKPILALYDNHKVDGYHFIPLEPKLQVNSVIVWKKYKVLTEQSKTLINFLSEFDWSVFQ